MLARQNEKFIFLPLSWTLNIANSNQSSQSLSICTQAHSFLICDLFLAIFIGTIIISMNVSFMMPNKLSTGGALLWTAITLGTPAAR